jgi:hypothetical protein
MHCLPYGTSAIYDFLLPAELASDGSNLPLFEPILVSGVQGIAEATPQEHSSPDEGEAAAATDAPAVAEAGNPAASSSGQAGETTSGRESAQAPAAASSSAQSEQAPSGKAAFMPPCHAVDISARKVYRCCKGCVCMRL